MVKVSPIPSWIFHIWRNSGCELNTASSWVLLPGGRGVSWNPRVRGMVLLCLLAGEMNFHYASCTLLISFENCSEMTVLSILAPFEKSTVSRPYPTNRKQTSQRSTINHITPPIPSSLSSPPSHYLILHSTPLITISSLPVLPSPSHPIPSQPKKQPS